jgi:hypothetical protein
MSSETWLDVPDELPAQTEQARVEVTAEKPPEVTEEKPAQVLPRPRRASSNQIKVIESPAIGCSSRTYQLVTATAEIRGVTRTEMLDLIVEQFFRRFI